VKKCSVNDAEKSEVYFVLSTVFYLSFMGLKKSEQMSQLSHWH